MKLLKKPQFSAWLYVGDQMRQTKAPASFVKRRRLHPQHVLIPFCCWWLSCVFGMIPCHPTENIFKHNDVLLLSKEICIITHHLCNDIIYISTKNTFWNHNEHIFYQLHPSPVIFLSIHKNSLLPGAWCKLHPCWVVGRGWVEVRWFRLLGGNWHWFSKKNAARGGPTEKHGNSKWDFHHYHLFSASRRDSIRGKRIVWRMEMQGEIFYHFCHQNQPMEKIQVFWEPKNQVTVSTLKKKHLKM